MLHFKRCSLKRYGTMIRENLNRSELFVKFTFLNIHCFNISFLNIWLALKRTVKNMMNGFYEEIHPSTTSGCGNLRGETQGYAVMTNCFQQSYTINTPPLLLFFLDPQITPLEMSWASLVSLLSAPNKGLSSSLPIFLEVTYEQVNSFFNDTPQSI